MISILDLHRGEFLIAVNASVNQLQRGRDAFIEAEHHVETPRCVESRATPRPDQDQHGKNASEDGRAAHNRDLLGQQPRTHSRDQRDDQQDAAGVLPEGMLEAAMAVRGE